MSSTDDARLLRFFRDRIVPAAEQLRERGCSFFAQGPDPEASTWWESGSEEEPALIEFDAADAARILNARWMSDGVPELAALAVPLLELAEELRATQEESGEVSPYVYVMY
jgi:hypothetical protein